MTPVTLASFHNGYVSVAGFHCGGKSVPLVLAIVFSMRHAFVFVMGARKLLVLFSTVCS